MIKFVKQSKEQKGDLWEQNGNRHRGENLCDEERGDI